MTTPPAAPRPKPGSLIIILGLLILATATVVVLAQAKIIPLDGTVQKILSLVLAVEVIAVVVIGSRGKPAAAPAPSVNDQAETVLLTNGAAGLGARHRIDEKAATLPMPDPPARQGPSVPTGVVDEKAETISIAPITVAPTPKPDKPKPDAPV